MIVLGIDPGVGGGLALLGRKPGQIIAVEKFDGRTLKDLGRLIVQAAKQADVSFLEKVTPSPPQRGDDRRSGTKSMFTFGKSVGHLEMALSLSGARFEEVTPATWQKVFGLYGSGSKSETTTQKKNRHKDLAEKLFPEVKITHAVADALLIAEYGRRLM